MMRKTTKFAFCLFACLGLLTSIPALVARDPAESKASYHYYYFKERKPLPLDASRVAVFHGGNVASEDIRGLGLGAFGLDDSDVSPSVIRGRSFIATKSETRNAERIVPAIGQIAAGTAVEFVSPVFVGLDGGPLVVTPRILVRFHDDVPAARAEAILAEVNAGVIADRNWAGMKGAFRVRSNSRNGIEVLDTANRLAVLPEVRWAEPDMMFTGRSELVPNDPFFGDCWGLHNTGQAGGTADMDMDAPEAWDFSIGDPSIKVLVIDTGVQQNHPDINQVPGMDFTSEAPGAGGGPINECDNHGTAVGGCVSAIINNNLGTVGVAPGTKVASARPFISNIPCNGGWSADYGWTVDALAWGESIGARVSNNSNSYGSESAAIADKYQETRGNGMVHFASAHNNNQPVSSFPASLPTVNSIAALERHGNRASFSNYGPDIFVSAPGETIMSTDRTGSAGYVGGDYVFVNGTSFASPHTAGVAALVLSVNPSLPPASVESILASTAVDLGVAGWDEDSGWGFVNAHLALQAAADPCDDPGPPDCNFNGILDNCDIFEGTSTDCNANSTPDECESAADCQPNTVPDICELYAGTSTDCDLSGTLDDCELAADPDCNGNSILDICDSEGVAGLTSAASAILGFVDIAATGTPLNLSEDGSATVTMPFISAAFATATLRISNNGGVGFGSSAVLSNPNDSLPSFAAFGGNQALLAYWDDLDSTTGNVYYHTVGTTPSQTFIVQWHNRPRFPGDSVVNGNEVTFQVQIFETPVDGVVAQCLYADTNFLNAAFNNGASATVGYQRSATSALQWSFDTAGAVTPSVVVSLLVGDRNGNGRPDDCDPSGPLTLGPPNRNRALGLSWPASTWPGPAMALRVTMLDLQNPVPPNLPANPPPDYSAYEAGGTCTDPSGCVRWVGPPSNYLESQDTPSLGNYNAARLQCTPHYRDWTGHSFYVTGAEIVPSSTYDVHSFAANCAGEEPTCVDFSAPLRLTTARSGDMEAPFSPPSTTTQPDVTDVAQLVNKFKNLGGAPVKAIAQLQPNLTELNADINALDVVAVVDAVKQKAYAFSGPCPCPSLMTCDTTPCATDAVCSALPAPSGGGPGAKCVKTCVDGLYWGLPCINDTHCPFGACGSGFCRDRCGRCTPP